MKSAAQQIIKEVLISLADKRIDKFRSRLISSEQWVKENTNKIKKEVLALTKKLVSECLDAAEQNLRPGDRTCVLRIDNYTDNITNMLSTDIQEKLKEYGITIWKIYKDANEVLDFAREIIEDEGFGIENARNFNNETFVIDITWEIPEYLKLKKAINWVKLYDDYQMFRFHTLMSERNDFGYDEDDTPPCRELTKKEEKYHEKKVSDYWKLLCKEVGADFDDYEDSIKSGYEDDIEAWLEKCLKDKYIGTEPDKKLKLNDPSKLEKIVNEDD